MNGKIWVESELGKGATFFLELPKKEILGMVEVTTNIVESNPSEILESDLSDQRIEEEASKLTLPINPDFPKTKFTILIVEDNHSLRDYLETILSPIYNIITAENGLMALDILATTIKQEDSSDSDKMPFPHLIISDIMMPVMDGYQFLKAIKAKKYFQELPVIMLTARAEIKDKLKALRIGVDDYLLKPFEEEELIARIENLLRNYHSRKNAIVITSSKGNQVEQKGNLPIISKEDQEWLADLEKLLLRELANSQYSINQLAYDLNISERQLRRRIKRLVGLTPKKYFKEIRLHQARNILENRKYKTVLQTAYAVGYQDVGSFSINYFNHFGKKPSEYLIQ